MHDISYLMGGNKGSHKVMLGKKGFSLGPYSGQTSGVFAGLNPDHHRPDVGYHAQPPIFCRMVKYFRFKKIHIYVYLTYPKVIILLIHLGHILTLLICTWMSNVYDSYCLIIPVHTSRT